MENTSDMNSVLQKIEKLSDYFGESMEASAQKRAALLADERSDEADFEKIRENVYGIFKDVFSAAVKTSAGNPAAICEIFRLKTEQIPANWKASYAQAKENEDVEKMQIESIKLETLEAVRSSFERIWGERE